MERRLRSVVVSCAQPSAAGCGRAATTPALASTSAVNQCWRIPVKLDVSAGPDGLRADLTHLGVPFSEGGWTFYLPPSRQRDNAFPWIAQSFLQPRGLKILKDFRRPGDARYTPHDANPAPGAALLRQLTPAPIALVRVANALADAGLGVAVRDIVELHASGIGLTAYVVGARGRRPTHPPPRVPISGACSNAIVRFGQQAMIRASSGTASRRGDTGGSSTFKRGSFLLSLLTADGIQLRLTAL